MVQWRLQVVQPRYAEAIRLANQALEESSSIKEAPRPLPYMYGSPEYLQVWQQAQSSQCQLRAAAALALRSVGRLHGCPVVKHNDIAESCHLSALAWTCAPDTHGLKP